MASTRIWLRGLSGELLMTEERLNLLLELENVCREAFQPRTEPHPSCNCYQGPRVQMGACGIPLKLHELLDKLAELVPVQLCDDDAIGASFTRRR